MKYLIINIVLLHSINLFGQMQKFDSIPKEILNQLDKMGIDNSPLLNYCESAYFNVVFGKSRKVFDFTEKKIGFLTGSSGKTKDSKKGYFNGEKERFYCNSTPTNGTLYIFNAAQKEESGGYDAVIVYWSKFLLPIEDVVRRVKNSSSR
ncbi:hypothetical protein FACS1894201_02460 [Bacteroidia bacterium]|nr:hypothetical protein FACS1894201_02460 [Bacteroidia bacterium]